MSQIHLCSDVSDTTDLCPALGLSLKPIARINFTVHFPTLKQTIPSMGGKSVSSWEVMEKVKALVAPEKFISLKVVKNTLEFIRFEGDLESRSILKTIVTRIDGKALKLTGFKELLKIRAAETKIPFPAKYDWDSFFRDARHMNEMKPGERPDTVHFQCLPCKWFSDKKSADKPMPSEKLFRRVWETFGEVRCIDIPVLDPYRQQMQSSIAGIKTFTFSQDPVFEAYVQYKDYISFVKAMDALRNCFLMYHEDSKSWVASVKVNFDKSKHLSDDSIRKRKTERERLIEEEKLRERATLKSKGVPSKESSPPRKTGDLTKEEAERVEYKIAKEERMYMVARRKLESVRLLDYIFDRIKKQRQKDLKGAGDEDDGSSRPSSVARSDRLSPSFYNVERSPRIDRCRSPRSETSPRYAQSRSHSRNRSRGRSRSHSRNRSRGRSRSHSRNRSRSRSRSRGRSRSRTRSRSRSRSHARSHSRSPKPRSSSPRRSRSPYDNRSRDASNDNDPRYNHRGSPGNRPHSWDERYNAERNRFGPENFDRIPRDGQQAVRYMNDWEFKSRGGFFRGGPRGRGIRGRGFVYRSPRGRPFHRPYHHNNSYGGDPRFEVQHNHNHNHNALQEAYNHAYTKYFNSISKGSETRRSDREMESERS